MAKLWAGRFQKETDLVVNDFNSSILFDCRLYKEDITGSIAHATMLGKQGIIEEHEAEKIVEGLKGILKDIEDGKVEFSLDYEDIHMNVEQLLTERIGDTGKRLHTGRSRNVLSFVWVASTDSLLSIALRASGSAQRSTSVFPAAPSGRAAKSRISAGPLSGS